MKNKQKQLKSKDKNNNGHKDNYKEIFNELDKERFGKIIELTNEINQNDLIYYFKGNSA